MKALWKERKFKSAEMKAAITVLKVTGKGLKKYRWQECTTVEENYFEGSFQ
jgi:hypothetical protein